MMWLKQRFNQLPGALHNAGALALVLGLVLAAMGLWLVEPIAMQNLRLAQFDQYQRWHPRVYTPVPVRVVDIDEASLKDYGQWPWPRTRIAELITRLSEAGAAVIALDVLLAEPDRTSPVSMAQLWQEPAVSALLRQMPDHDAALASAMVDRRVVLGSSLSHGVGALGPQSNTALPPRLPYRMVNSGAANLQRWLPGFDSAVWPLPVLAASASGLGALNFSADSDGVVRRVPMLLALNGQSTPSLSAEALRVAQGAQNYVVRSNAAGVQDLRIGSLTVPTNAQAELWLHYTEEVPGRYVSAAQVLRGTVDPELLSGNLVLVGSSAAGLMDMRANPMGQLTPGVQAHANALEQVLTGQHLQRPSWAVGLEALVMVLGALLVGLVALGAPAKRAAGVLLVALALLWAGTWFAFVRHGWLVDAVNPAWVLLLSFGVCSAVHHVVVERQQRWLRTAFSRYVSPNRVEHLVAHPEQLQLGGQRQVCSFVFTDLAGFTPMMEASDPAQVVALLNDYLEAMLVIVFRHEGTLDRFVGDAMVVLFSAPVVQADHRQRALDCALEMDAFATAYAMRLQAQGIPWGLTRIGVHCGEVIVGNFGGKALFDYRALGDPINTAARLETVNKHLGTRVCVSQAILAGCAGVPTRAVGRLVLKGKTHALQVFTPDATLDPALCAPAQEYQAALTMLQTDTVQGHGAPLHSALAAFEALAARYPQDPLVALHLQRLRQGAMDDLIVMHDK
jgi:adenylate cyclase